MSLKYLTCVIVLVISSVAVGENIADTNLTYQQMVVAIRSGDFQTMRSYHEIQEGLTFEALEKNWSRAQKVYEGIFPSLEEITLLKNIQRKNGSRYWIVELNAVDQGNKHIKSYKFTPDRSNRSGWKVYATRYFGSYNYPDQMGIKGRVVNDIEKGIMSE